MAAVVLDDYLPNLEETPFEADGRPLLLPVELIDEDPLQPRTEFDAESLEELATTIALRGVRQPVSVRPHPDQAGHWMLNFGARRLRAPRIAGKSEIPAFIDEMPDGFDQIIENEQREALKPMELALFVQRQLASGLSQADIARRLGKSKAYICYVSALIDPPDWLIAAYRDGRCRGVKELHDLRRLHDEHPEEVMRILVERTVVSRGAVADLREQLAPGSLASVRPLTVSEPPDTAHVRAPLANVGSPSAAEAVDPSASFQARPQWSLYAEVDGRTVKIVLNAFPSAPDEVVVAEEGARSRGTVKLVELRAMRLQRD
jgi:ParB family transcriptional regulator, chromosome partitioning protein